MKIKILSLLLILGLGFVSCNNDDDDDNNEITYNAITLREAGNCHLMERTKSLYLIEFKKEVSNLPVKNQRIYHAVNLPEKYKTKGLKFNATFRKLTTEERNKFGCYSTGMKFMEVDEFPFIYIENIK